MVKRHTWLLLLGCSLIPLLNFPRALFADRTLFVRDVTTVWSPQVEAVVRQVAAGHPPFFDARRGFGQPLFADPRAEVLYPFAWIHWVLPPDRSYALFCALHLIVGALGAARLARRIVPDASVTAQLTAALAFGASGPLLSLVSHWHHLAAVAWMPWILERCDPKPGASTPWLSLAVLVALQILAGSPDYTLTTFLLCFLRLATLSDRPLQLRAKVGLALLLGVLLSAVQTVPSFFFASEAAREKYPPGWALSPLHPALTLETALPLRAEAWPLTEGAAATLWGGQQVWMFSHYLGLSVWVLAWIGLKNVPSGSRRFALGAIGLGVLMSWGVRNEMLKSIVAEVPLISGLRFPTKHLAAVSLGLALLAAGATRAQAPRRRPLAIGIAFLLLASIALHLWATGTAAPPLATLTPLFLPVALVAVTATFVGRAAFFTSLLPLVVGADLLATQAHLNPTTPSTLFRNRPPLTASVPRESRLYVSDYSISVPAAPTPPGGSEASSIRPAQGAPYRLKQMPVGFSPRETVFLAATSYLNPPIAGRFGYYGSFDLDVLDFYRAPLKQEVRKFVTSRDPRYVVERLQRGSVDYVITMDAPELWSSLPLIQEERRFFEDPVRIYRVPDPWPRVRFETEEGALANAGTSKVLEMRDGRIVVHADVAKPTRLVVAMANDRGWRALVNGARTDVSDNPMAFVSVPLGAGSQRVEIDFVPPGLELGAWLSVLALATAVWLARRP